MLRLHDSSPMVCGDRHNPVESLAIYALFVSVLVGFSVGSRLQ
jgi:hypothetical protein